MSDSSIQTSMLAGQTNFNVKHEYRDFYADVQRNMKRIGDVGDESDEFLERAYNQFKNHDFNKLAKIQDKFITEDPIYGTPGRENHRNYNRMEYDYNDRFDDNGKEDVEKEVADKTELTVNKLLNAFKDHGWTLNNTATAVGNKPITQKDYDKQMKM
jgi:hypothetical protein